MTHPRVSFVIPVRDDAARLRRCLQSVQAASRATPVEVIVADNGSTDASARVARDAGARVISLPDRAVAAVRNDAAAVARGDLLAFVDADHEVCVDWTAAAVELFDQPTVSAAGAEYRPPPNATWVQRMCDRFRSHADGPRPVDWLPSGNLVVRRETFARVGGFDTSLESCEDVDLCRRVREAGGTLIESGRLRSIHHGDPATLKALFLAELWRGRDNIRVSLRERLTARTAPSLVMPLLGLVAIGLVAAGGVTAAAGYGGIRWLAIGSLTLAALTSIRSTRLWLRIPPGQRGLGATAQAIAVAATYEIARALALVTRADHGVRRRG